MMKKILMIVFPWFIGQCFQTAMRLLRVRCGVVTGWTLRDTRLCLGAMQKAMRAAVFREDSLAGDFHILLINPPQSTGLLT